MTMPPPTEFVVFEKDVSTKEDFYVIISAVIWKFARDRECTSVFENWGRVVRSKTTTTTKMGNCCCYTISRTPTRVPMFFPHAVPDAIVANLRPVCGVLKEEEGEDDGASAAAGPKTSLDNNNNNMSKMISWFSGTVVFRISPENAWDLKEEDISELSDPPISCKVEVAVSGLVFEEYTCIEQLCNSDVDMLNNNPIEICNENIATGAGSLSACMSYLAGISHHHSTEEYSQNTEAATVEQRLWYDLVSSSQSRVGKKKNVFNLKMPFLIRMVSRGYNQSRIPDGVGIATMGKEKFDSIYMASRYDTDARIGLFSANLRMDVSRNGCIGVPPLNEELWKDIPLCLDDLALSSCDCRVNLALMDIKFVSFTSDDEIISMNSGNNSRSNGNNNKQSSGTFFEKLASMLMFRFFLKED